VSAAAPTPARKAAAAAIPPALPAKTPMPAPQDVAPSLFAATAAWARREWMMLGGGLAGGIALGSIVWLVAAMQAPPDITVADAAEPSAAAEPQETQAPTPMPEIQEAPAEALPEVAPVVEEKESDAGTVEVAAPVETPPGEAEEAAKPPAEVEPGDEAVPGEPAKNAVAPALKLEPIAPSGEGTSNSAAASGPEAATPSAGNDAAEESVPDDPKVVDDEGPDETSQGEAAAVSREEIEKRLGLSLARVEFVEVPLAQFTVFVADIAGVTVTIDDAALAKAGKTRRMPLTVKLDDTTAGDALRAALERGGLVYTIDEGRIVVSVAAQ
jgi:hypothetical protein